MKYFLLFVFLIPMNSYSQEMLLYYCVEIQDSIVPADSNLCQKIQLDKKGRVIYQWSNIDGLDMEEKYTYSDRAQIGSVLTVNGEQTDYKFLYNGGELLYKLSTASPEQAYQRIDYNRVDSVNHEIWYENFIVSDSSYFPYSRKHVQILDEIIQITYCDREGIPIIVEENHMNDGILVKAYRRKVGEEKPFLRISRVNRE